MKTSGSITPSSRHLVRKCLKNVDFAHARVIVEFGVGDGVITEEILNQLNPNCRLIALEINKNLCAYSSERFRDFNKLELHCASAFEFDSLLKELGIDKVDYIISSLPLSLFKKNEIENLFKKIPNYLAEGGAYIQYQYTLGKYPYFKKVFDQVSVDFTLRNAPPALIFTCTTD